MAGRVGIHDVAAAAGVSTTTVSHALNNRGKVSPLTRERVRAIADQLGYEPSRIATALRGRRTGVLGFVSDEIATTPFAGRIVLGAQEAAAEADQTLMVVNTGKDGEVERRQIRALRAQQVDGLVYAAMFHRPVQVPAAIGSLPMVLVNGIDDGSSAPSVVPDEVDAGREATRLLLDAGHRRIAHLTIDEPGFASDGRTAGYQAAMRAAGLVPHVVEADGTAVATAGAGRDAFTAALAEEPGTTAVFCFNDQMAMGVYQVASAFGMAVPDDLSVVGVDNLEVVAAALLPPLTTLALPHYEMGRWAVTELVRRLDAVDEAPIRTWMRCPAIVRASIGPPR